METIMDGKLTANQTEERFHITLQKGKTVLITGNCYDSLVNSQEIITPMKVRKLLITGGCYDTEMYRNVKRLREKRMSVEQIGELSVDNVIVSCENINKKFKSKTVLEDVSFEIKRGEFLSLLGPSGCGKTTILRMLIGIEKPSSGRIMKDGVDITNTAPKDRNIGIVFQNYSLLLNTTISMYSLMVAWRLAKRV